MQVSKNQIISLKSINYPLKLNPMKRSMKVFVSCSVLAGIMFLSAAQAQTEKTKDKVKAPAEQASSYSATYSSKFEIGNPAHTTLIMNVWKDWDANTLDNSAKFFADTLVMYSPDGTMTKGKELNLAEAKKYRGKFTTVKSTIQAIISLKSTDRNEDWVAVWGTEEDTDNDGKKTSVALHEVWRFNKDGKIDLMRQYSAKVPEGL